MADLAPSSPLMALIHYQGQDYYTSHFFHRQYLANGQQQAQIKYRRYPDFVRTMKTIPAYDLYIQKCDIVELHWISKRQQGKADSALVLQINKLEPQFHSAGYKPLYLLNATAQLALGQHLDDELSKQMSVAVNTQAARQSLKGTPLSTVAPMELATREMRAWLEAASDLFVVPLHIAQQEGVKMITARHGIDFAPLLLAAPAQTGIPDADVMLEPTQLAQALGVESARAMNLLLQRWGLQIRHTTAGWVATPAGAKISTRHAWVSGAKSGYNLKWRLDAVQTIMRTASLAGEQP